MAKLPTLVDTNVMIEAHRTSSWRALRGGYPVETVETCLIETQTGAQNRRPEQRIDEAELRGDLRVYLVTDRERAMALVAHPMLGNLDAGERDLWCHALARPDAWILCSPDKASLRLGIALGLADRLVALEALLDGVGHRPKVELRRNYTKAWHRQTLAELSIQVRRV